METTQQTTSEQLISDEERDQSHAQTNQEIYGMFGMVTFKNSKIQNQKSQNN